MSGRRLHGWARIGIVLLNGLGDNREFLGAQPPLRARLPKLCNLPDSVIASASDCRQLYETQFADARQRRLTAVAVVGLGPIPVAWLLVYALVALVRWIKRGFQSTP